MLRVKFNLSQDEVAGRLNISAATWSKWERA
ncbi:helix-turn-helix transcriptional regulator, partial [Gemella sp. zg-1178]|nr:helix-turn-helix domain-containing protein [Gemella sp. zg-1178]MBU0279404.1 helix-turn-helix domain-containing protein [Gemella sp. zg-1178]